jgi:hypothetical protein
MPIGPGMGPSTDFITGRAAVAPGEPPSFALFSPVSIASFAGGASIFFSVAIVRPLFFFPFSITNCPDCCSDPHEIIPQTDRSP